MRKGKLAVLALPALALLLGGCLAVDTTVEPRVAFTVEVVPPLTVVCDATGTVGSPLVWDFGDGTVAEGGLVVSHTYAEPGRYAVILTVGEGDAGDGGMGPPGPGGGGGTGTKSGAAYQIVDLLQADGPEPVIVTFDSAGNPTREFLSWTTATYWAGASSGDGELWYQWEIVRVNDDAEPIPLDWEDEPRFYRSSEETFKLRMPGPSCGGNPWRYRVRLIVSDEAGRHREAVVYVTVY